MAENATGAIIGNLGVVDPDVGDTHTWSVDDVRFEVVAGQLKLKAGQSLNFESEASVNLTITATDAGALSYNEPFVITVTNANEAPNDITLDNTTLAENAAGAIIGNLGVVDPDVGDTHTWSVDDVRFEVVAGQLKLKAGQSLNFESEPSVNLTITATDAGTLSCNELFAITVTNVNEVPTDITLDNTTVAENAAGAIIGNLGVVDPDVGDTHTWSVDDVRFEVVAGQLRLKAGQSLNFESEASVNLTITATDAGTLSYNELFAITVTNVNEAPADITLDNTTLAENAAGAIIGNLGVVDPDVGDTHTWSVDDVRFEVVAGQLKLKAGQSVNFESEPSVNLTITATDAGTLSYNELFAITVTNVNEAPTDITLDNTTLAENTAGAIIGNLGVVDPDVGDTHTWSVDDVRFEVVAGELRLKAGQSLNFESEPTVNLTITATDNGKLSYNEPFVITVTNASEAPNDITLDNATVAENASGAIVGNLGVVDPDVGDTHTWNVDDLRFEVVAGQLKLKAGQSLNFESEPNINLTITATDAGTLSYNELFAITVTNVNEAPTDITLDNTTLAENAAGAIIGNLGVVDPDVGDTHTWSVDDLRFEVVAGQLKLRTGQSVDFESEPNVNLTITVSDGANASAVQTIGIAVADINEPATVTLTNAVRSLAENTDTTAGVKVAHIIISDDALGTNHLMLRGADAALFEIVNGRELHLKAGQSLDFETQSLVSVTVEIDDPAIGAMPDNVARLSLRVVDVPEDISELPPPPPLLPPPLPFVAHETPHGESDLAGGGSAGTTPTPNMAQPPPTPRFPTHIDRRHDAFHLIRQPIPHLTDDLSRTASDSHASHVRFDPAMAHRPNPERGRSAAQRSTTAAEMSPIFAAENDGLLGAFQALRNEVRHDTVIDTAFVGTTFALASGISIGYVVWLIRGGVLLSSFVTSLPAWNLVDPLPVLAAMKTSGGNDDESLESLIRDGKKIAAEKSARDATSGGRFAFATDMATSNGRARS